jgi:hypothetical protein
VLGAAACLTVALAACGSTPDETPATSAAPAPTSAAGAGAAPLALVMNRFIVWRGWHGTRLPFSDRWGPAHVNGDIATGFDHSPEGAVIAMMQQRARLAGVGDQAWPAAAAAMAVLAPADQPPATRVTTGFDTTGDVPYFAGFRWQSYTPDRASAELALEKHDGTLESVPATEVWQGGDWKVELPAGGAAVTPLDGLDQYQPWPSTPR